MLFYWSFVFLQLFLNHSNGFWPPSYKVDLEDDKTFVISFEDDNDEENINEMIQPKDLIDIPSLHQSNDKYKALHNHVKYYNRRAATNKAIQKRKIPKSVPNSFPMMENIDYVESRPFVAGFREELDKYNIYENNAKENLRDAREYQKPTTVASTNLDYEGEGQTSLIIELDDHNNTYKNNEKNKTVVESDVAEEVYDYDNFKAEYDQQVKESVNKNQTFNYTDKVHLEDTPAGAIKQIFQYKKPKNCTEEELKKFGLQAFECLVFDYKQPKKKINFKLLLSRTWTVLKVWIIIYLIFAIPCWCYKGWCCCCCRCSFCFPRKQIIKAKRFYVYNPPGVFAKQPHSKEDPAKYKPTLLELDAYMKFEVAIKNL